MVATNLKGVIADLMEQEEIMKRLAEQQGAVAPQPAPAPAPTGEAVPADAPAAPPNDPTGNVAESISSTYKTSLGSAPMVSTRPIRQGLKNIQSFQRTPKERQAGEQAIDERFKKQQEQVAKWGTDRQKIVDEFEADITRMRTKHEEIRKNKAEAAIESVSKLNRMDLLNRYGYGSQTRVLKLLDVLESDDALPEERAEAQKELDRYEDIDPNRALGGLGGTIMAALAMAMGAYGAALTGGPNYAKQVIDGIISRDIAAQKARYRKRGQEREFAKDEFARNMSVFDDELIASEAAIAQRYDKLSRFLTLQAAQVQDEKLAMEFTNLAEAAKQQADAKDFEVANAVMRGQEAITDIQARNAASRGRREEIKDSYGFKTWQTEQGLAAAKAKGSSLIKDSFDVARRRIPKFFRINPENIYTEHEIRKLQEVGTKIAPVMEAFRALVETRERLGAEILTARANVGKADLKSMHAALVTAFKDLRGFGAAFSVNELQLVLDEIGAKDPTAIDLDNAILKALKHSAQRTANGAHQQVRSYNASFDVADLFGGKNPFTESTERPEDVASEFQLSR